MKEEKNAKPNRESNRTKAVIAILATTACIVILSVVMMSLYFTGVFDDALSVRKKNDKSEQNADAVVYTEYNVPSSLPAGLYADLTIGYGEQKFVLTAYLLSNYAPNTVNNFVSYANAGFYNGTVLGADKKRLEEGKVVCGGYVRNSDGTVSQKIPAEQTAPIKGEFYENGYTANRLGNVKGTIGMIHSAKSNDDATTDFYMLSEDATELNGKYAVFGKITTESGVNSLRFLAQKAKNGEAVTIQKIEIYTRR